MNNMSNSFVVLAFIVSIFSITTAEAGVCFVVGNCGQDKSLDMLTCGEGGGNEYKAKDLTNQHMLGEGSPCSVGKEIWWPACLADLSYYRWDKTESGNAAYDYSGWAKSANASCKYVANRYHAKYCKAEYKYVASGDKDKRTMNHKPVSTCPSGVSVNASQGSCLEVDGLKSGSSSYMRYKACSCPSTYSKSCGGEGQTGGGQECNGKYSSCVCAAGYSGDGNTCTKNTGGGTSHPEISEGWILYYAKDANRETLDKLRVQYNEEGKKAGDEQYLIAGIRYIEDTDEEEMKKIQEELGVSEIYEVEMHPLFSTSYYNADWGFDLGVPDKIIGYEGGSLSDYNFPIMLYGTIHSGGLYDSDCDEFTGEKDEEPEKDEPKEFAYAGFVGDMPKVINAYKPETIIAPTGGTVSGSSTALMFRPYAHTKGCHPEEYPMFEKAGCSEYECDIFGELGLDRVYKFGGDKCIQYVFGHDEAVLPSIVLDPKGGVIYKINSEPRYRVELNPGVAWREEKVMTPKGEDYTDYAGNFLVGVAKKKEPHEAYESICHDNDIDYENRILGDINTWPDMNAFYDEKAIKGEDVKDIIEILQHDSHEDTGSNILPTFVGEASIDPEAYFEAKYYNEAGLDGVEDYYWRKYFNNAMGNIVNGAWAFSTPYKEHREEGDGPETIYEAK